MPPRIRLPGMGFFRGPNRGSMAERLPIRGNLAMRPELAVPRQHEMRRPHEGRIIGFNPRAAFEGAGRAMHEFNRARGAGAPLERTRQRPMAAAEIARMEGFEAVERELEMYERKLGLSGHGEIELRRKIFGEIKKCGNWEEVRELMGKLMDEGLIDRERYNRLFHPDEQELIFNAFHPGKVATRRMAEQGAPFQ